MEVGKCLGKRFTVTAADVTAGSLRMVVDSAQLTGAIVVVRDAAGALKAWDGVATVTGDQVVIDNAGAVDWAATDTVDVIAF